MEEKTRAQQQLELELELITDGPFMRRNLLKKSYFVLSNPWRAIQHYRIFGGNTRLNILKTFPMFVAHGWGLYQVRSQLTIKSINQLVPALAELCKNTRDNASFRSQLMTAFEDHESASQARLKSLFDSYGSDKGTKHDYYRLYSLLLEKSFGTQKILEIGLGTNNTDIVSTMGKDGRPGASLRAFRDLLPDSQIYGADFDKRVLFEEDRIQTFFVDQTEPRSFLDLGSKIGADFDLMIDDGLHAPNANIHSLSFFMKHVKIGGFIVIEDVDPSTTPIWTIVSELISKEYSSALINTKTSCMFVAQRLQ